MKHKYENIIPTCTFEQTFGFVLHTNFCITHVKNKSYES